MAKNIKRYKREKERDPARGICISNPQASQGGAEVVMLGLAFIYISVQM